MPKIRKIRKVVHKWEKVVERHLVDDCLGEGRRIIN